LFYLRPDDLGLAVCVDQVPFMGFILGNCVS